MALLTLAADLCEGTVGHMIAVNELELDLDLQALLGTQPSVLLTGPSKLHAIRYRAISRGWAFHPSSFHSPCPNSFSPVLSTIRCEVVADHLLALWQTLCCAG